MLNTEEISRDFKIETNRTKLISDQSNYSKDERLSIQETYKTEIFLVNNNSSEIVEIQCDNFKEFEMTPSQTTINNKAQIILQDLYQDEFGYSQKSHSIIQNSALRSEQPKTLQYYEHSCGFDGQQSYTFNDEIKELESSKLSFSHVEKCLSITSNKKHNNGRRPSKIVNGTNFQQSRRQSLLKSKTLIEDSNFGKLNENSSPQTNHKSVKIHQKSSFLKSNTISDDKYSREINLVKLKKFDTIGGGQYNVVEAPGLEKSKKDKAKNSYLIIPMANVKNEQEVVNECNKSNEYLSPCSDVRIIPNQDLMCENLLQARKETITEESISLKSEESSILPDSKDSKNSSNSKTKKNDKSENLLQARKETIKEESISLNSAESYILPDCNDSDNSSKSKTKKNDKSNEKKSPAQKTMNSKQETSYNKISNLPGNIDTQKNQIDNENCSIDNIFDLVNFNQSKNSDRNKQSSERIFDNIEKKSISKVYNINNSKRSISNEVSINQQSNVFNNPVVNKKLFDKDNNAFTNDKIYDDQTLFFNHKKVRRDIITEKIDINTPNQKSNIKKSPYLGNHNTNENKSKKVFKFQTLKKKLANKTTSNIHIKNQNSSVVANTHSSSFVDPCKSKHGSVLSNNRFSKDASLTPAFSNISSKGDRNISKDSLSVRKSIQSNSVAPYNLVNENKPQPKLLNNDSHNYSFDQSKTNTGEKQHYKSTFIKADSDCKKYETPTRKGKYNISNANSEEKNYSLSKNYQASNSFLDNLEDFIKTINKTSFFEFRDIEELVANFKNAKIEKEKLLKTLQNLECYMKIIREAINKKLDGTNDSSVPSKYKSTYENFNSFSKEVTYNQVKNFRNQSDASEMDITIDNINQENATLNKTQREGSDIVQKSMDKFKIKNVFNKNPLQTNKTDYNFEPSKSNPQNKHSSSKPQRNQFLKKQKDKNHNNTVNSTVTTDLKQVFFSKFTSENPMLDLKFSEVQKNLTGVTLQKHHKRRQSNHKIDQKQPNASLKNQQFLGPSPKHNRTSQGSLSHEKGLRNKLPNNTNRTSMFSQSFDYRMESKITESNNTKKSFKSNNNMRGEIRKPTGKFYNLEENIQDKANYSSGSVCNTELFENQKLQSDLKGYYKEKGDKKKVILIRNQDESKLNGNEKRGLPLFGKGNSHNNEKLSDSAIKKIRVRSSSNTFKAGSDKQL